MSFYVLMRHTAPVKRAVLILGTLPTDTRQRITSLFCGILEPFLHYYAFAHHALKNTCIGVIDDITFPALLRIVRNNMKHVHFL